MKLWILIWVSVSALASPLAEGATPLESLTLDQALEMADSLQPQIAEAKAMIEAAAGRARQAGAFPNPEGIVGAQQLGGANSEEFVAGVGQAIPPRWPTAGRCRRESCRKPKPCAKEPKSVTLPETSAWRKSCRCGAIGRRFS
jgi:hypothetical protein